MWERTLQDLVRGLRANKKDESKFIAKAVDEIRQEIKNEDMELKAGAVLKLVYLDMLGYDMTWASFHVVEVMSSPKVHLKSVGYLAATQSFDQDTDVLMLTTNLLKKDLSSTPADIAVTLNGLSHIVTPELARDLAPEVIAMLNHSRPQIRKRAILALYKLLARYPEAAPHARSRLEERLDDSDPSVVAATVNVLCELARKNPKDYLSLAPQFFHLLTSSSNNWMLIKIIKLFGSLSPHEPRLVKKLQPPITELISTTPAISLLYECVHTCIIGGMLGGPSGLSLAKLCISKLAGFIQDSDQNLKYIALLAMTKIVPSYPHLVEDYQDTIISSVNDQDVSIRMRALDLIAAMANRSNLQSIIQQLLTHLVGDSTTALPTAVQSLTQSSTSPPKLPPPSQSPAYRLVLCQRILQMCSQSTYENVTNFEWYLSVLVELAHIANVNIGSQIRDQLVDVSGRVRGTRRYAVKLMYTLLADETMSRDTSDGGRCCEVLWAAAWICGEYCYELAEPAKLLPYLLQPNISTLPADIVAVYVQATIKIFGYWTAELGESWSDSHLQELKQVVQVTLDRLQELQTRQHIELQERVANALQLFTFILVDLNAYTPKPLIPSMSTPNSGSSSAVEEPFATEELNFPKSLYLIQPLFSSYELNPVATNAQGSVAVPEGLDLDAWIIQPPREVVVRPGSDDLRPAGEKKKKKVKKGKGKDDGVSPKSSSKSGNEPAVLTPLDSDAETPEERAEREQRKAQRLAQLKEDPYYITDTRSPKPTAEDVDSIPVVHLEDMPPIDETRLTPPTLRVTSQTFSSQTYEIEKEGEMPVETIMSRSTNLAQPGEDFLPSYPRNTIPPLPSFQPYEVPEDPPTSTMPEPIKVRSKKKASKKKRTTDV